MRPSCLLTPLKEDWCSYKFQVGSYQSPFRTDLMLQEVVRSVLPPDGRNIAVWNRAGWWNHVPFVQRSSECTSRRAIFWCRRSSQSECPTVRRILCCLGRLVLDLRLLLPRHPQQGRPLQLCGIFCTTLWALMTHERDSDGVQARE